MRSLSGRFVRRPRDSGTTASCSRRVERRARCQHGRCSQYGPVRIHQPPALSAPARRGRGSGVLRRHRGDPTLRIPWRTRAFDAGIAASADSNGSLRPGLSPIFTRRARAPPSRPGPWRTAAEKLPDSSTARSFLMPSEMKSIVHGKGCCASEPSPSARLAHRGRLREAKAARERELKGRLWSRGLFG